MVDVARNFGGSIPEYYDSIMGRAQFEAYGTDLVRRLPAQAGGDVLEIACGTGRVTRQLRDALSAGVRLVATDLSEAMLDFARARVGGRIEWQKADATALPFKDASFDAALCAFGVMFVPDHGRVAAELTRVCRPGGTIGLASFTPESLLTAFFGVFAPYMPPPPPGALPPVLWGHEEHVRELFGDRVSSLRLERRVYVERAADPAAYCALCKETFGPIVTVYESLADEPEAVAALDRSFLDFAKRSNAGRPGGAAKYPYEYLLAVAQTVA